MGKRTLICLAAGLNLVIGGAACSSARGNEGADEGRASGSGETTTVSGCLSGSADGRFVLTAAPDAAVAATERALGDERETHSYVLTGGDNLQAHVGHRVEVTGTISGRTQELDHDAKSKTEQPPSGDKTPTVATKEEVEIEVRQLNVQTVRPLAQPCTATP